jgi:hypothetical protein
VNNPVQTRLPWGRVVELATQLEAVYVTRGEIDREIAVRLARAVLDFQSQLLGGLVKTTSSRARAP